MPDTTGTSTMRPRSRLERWAASLPARRPRSCRRCLSTRAPARTSTDAASHAARSASSSRSTAMHTSEPVSRRNSIRAEVSTSITLGSSGVIEVSVLAGSAQ